MLSQSYKMKELIQQNMKISFVEKEMPNIEDGVTYNIVTQKVINPYSFILQAVKQFGTIKHLYIATYSINIKAFSIICNLMDEGLVENWTLVINCNMKFQMRGKDVYLLEEEKKRPNFNIIKKYSHAKVTLIEQENRKIVITGSGNYSENPKIEQYTINKDDGLFKFHRGWMLE